MLHLVQYLSRLGAFALLSLSALSCAAHHAPYVNNATQARISLDQSPNHEFKDVRAYVDEEAKALVVYGKVMHSHDNCPTEGYVALAVIDSNGAVTVRQNLPITRRGGKHGWLGAAFRGRIDGIPSQGSQIQLVFHDSDCATKAALDVGGS